MPILAGLSIKKKNTKKKKNAREITGDIILENIEQINSEYGRITSPNIEINLLGTKIKAIINSGADTNIISEELVEKMGLDITEKSNVKLTGFNRTEEKSKGKIKENIEINGAEFPIKLEVVDTGRREKILLGVNWLKGNNVNLNFGNNSMTLTGKNGKKCRIPIILYQEESSESETEYEGDSETSSEGYGSEDSQFNDTDWLGEPIGEI